MKDQVGSGPDSVLVLLGATGLRGGQNSTEQTSHDEEQPLQHGTRHSGERSQSIQRQQPVATSFSPSQTFHHRFDLQHPGC